MINFELEYNTMDRFLVRCRELYGERPFLAYEGESYNTYAEFCTQVEAYRIILREQGFKKGDVLALLGAGSPQWAILWMAAMTSGIVAVPIMEDFPPADVEYILLHSKARGLCLESRFVPWELEAYSKMDFLYNLTEKQPIRQNPPVPVTEEEIIIEECDPAEYMYTSGTTGFSKGVILSHGNLVSNLFKGTDLIDNCFNEDSLVISFLPVGHTFGSTSSFLSVMYKGPRIAFLKRKPTVPYLADVFKRNQPTILGAVPLIFEKIYQKQVLPAKNKSRPLRFVLDRFAPLRKIFHRAAAKKVLDFLGGKVECIIIGGAPFSPEVELFMQEGKIPYVLGYGLTETSPLLTFCSLEEVKPGSVGHAVPDTEIKLLDMDEESGVGEILVRGPQVMSGYLDDPDGTSEVFTEDGWFITGDKGYLDSEGFLFLRGRSKNVILSSSGENIYPEAIEALLTSYPCVEDVLVHQEEGQLVARIFPDYEYIEKQAGSLKPYDRDLAIKEQFEELRTLVNDKLSSSSYLYRILEQIEPFIKTPTKKIKRGLYFRESGKA